jgi:hypothetical protein
MMSRRSFITVGLLIITGSMLGSQAATRNMIFDQDLLKAFGPKGSGVAELVSEYQHDGPLTGKLFVDRGSLNDDEIGALKLKMLAAGYIPAVESLLNDPQIKASSAILSAQWIKQSGHTDEFEDKAVHELAAFFSLPGADDLAMKADPLGLLRALASGAHGPSEQSAMAKKGIEIWSSPRPYEHQSAEKIWHLAEENAGKAFFIGEDLFRFVNERAVRGDVALASTISVVLNAAVFMLFIRNWYFLGIFFTGSAVSWVFLCVALRSCFSEVFPIVFGFASTFFSFNSEYLVHLCGIDADRKAIVRRGMVSAVGTTLIGLIVLLASSSPLIQQMAVAAIAGLVGFFFGTIPFAPILPYIKIDPESGRNALSSMTSHTARYASALRTIFAPPRNWVMAACVSIAVVLGCGIPNIRTDIAQFRFAPQLLLDTETHFMNLIPKDAASYAVQSKDLSAVGRDFEASLVKAIHQLTTVPAPAVLGIKKFSEAVVNKLNLLGFDVVPQLFSDAYHLDAPNASAKLAIAAASLAGTTQLAGGEWTVVTATSKEAESWTNQGVAIHKIDPKTFYNDLLTAYARQTMVLFAIGFVAMVVYLLAVQRSFRKVLLVMTPLLIFFIVGGMVISVFGIALNIIHVIGLVLVIGFALDYTAIAVTSDFEDIEMSKILITGVSTIASFAGLCFASHPFLRMLGFAVVPGVIVSLIFALVIDRSSVKRFLNRKLGRPAKATPLIVVLLISLISGCQTPQTLMSTKAQRYRHPHSFVAEQSLCILARMKKVCFIGELQRSGEIFSLTIMEPSMLSILLAAESSTLHSVRTLVKANDDFTMRMDPAAILDTIRQLHRDSESMMNRGSIDMTIENGQSYLVDYAWGTIGSGSCPYPESLQLDFPATPSVPSLVLDIRNTKVNCDVANEGSRP